MAAETPFGLSFGDPRKYMGQSGLGQVGQALKTFALISGLEKSGAIKALDNIGIKPDSKGGFTYNRSPAGAVPPATPSNGGVNAGAMASTPMPVSPSSPSQPVVPAAPVAPLEVTPFGQDAPSNVQINTPPPDAGMQILNGTFRPQSAIDVQNQTDFNPLAPDASNQVALTGNEYQQVPGFGSAQDKAGKLMKIMGMG